MSEKKMTDVPTAESIIGTVVGEMMALRKGPNRHTKEVVESVVAQIDLLRTLLNSQTQHIAELERENAGLVEEVDSLNEEGVRRARAHVELKEAYAKLSASHNPEVCVDTMEYAEALKVENVELKSTQAHHLKMLDGAVCELGRLGIRADEYGSDVNLVTATRKVVEEVKQLRAAIEHLPVED